MADFFASRWIVGEGLASVLNEMSSRRITECFCMISHVTHLKLSVWYVNVQEKPPHVNITSQ